VQPQPPSASVISAEVHAMDVAWARADTHTFALPIDMAAREARMHPVGSRRSSQVEARIDLFVHRQLQGGC